MSADQPAAGTVRSLAQIRRDARASAHDALQRLAAVVDELRSALAEGHGEEHRLREQLREAHRRVIELDGEIAAWFDPGPRQREAVERARRAARESPDSHKSR